MEIINVIEVISGIVDHVESFVILDLDDPIDRGKQINNAEKLFEELALKNGMQPEDLEFCIDSGSFHDQNGYEILITWSNVNL